MDDPGAADMAGNGCPEDELGGEKSLDELTIELPYVPDFLLDDLRFWFVPSIDAPRAAYHELVGDSAKNWAGYYITKKGVNFFRSDSEGDGPYRVRPGQIRFEVLQSGRFFSAKPCVRLRSDADPVPLPSIERLRPINPWKPNYIQALNFIKKYEWEHELPRRVVLAMYEIEECGQVAGSVSWKNGEKILLESDSPELRATLYDFFYNRPEDYELGSQVYLRVLAMLGPEGFQSLDELAKHPITRKRKHVARALGELESTAGAQTLLFLLDDEDFGVRDAALQGLVTVGVDDEIDSEGKVRAYLESDDIRHRVWAAAALLTGGDESQRKPLVQLVKEEPRPLSDLGELGQICVRLQILDAVPFLIKRFKSDDDELAIDAGETLSQLTGLELEYNVVDDKAARGAATKALTQWWDRAKKERRKKK